jgi:hypothetical protein
MALPVDEPRPGLEIASDALHALRRTTLGEPVLIN